MGGKDGGCCSLNRGVRIGLIERVLFEQKIKDGAQVSHSEFWGLSFPDRGGKASTEVGARKMVWLEQDSRG